MVQAHNTIGTADGRSITPPKAMIPRRPTRPASAFPFSEDIALVIADHWSHGADYLIIADAVVDLICKHLRSPLAKLDRRLADAIEDHMQVDPLEGDADAEGECSIEDIEAHRARKLARADLSLAQRPNSPRFTREEAAALVGAMLKRPEETNRYLALRALDHGAAEALSIVLNERREAKARNDHAWNGGAL